LVRAAISRANALRSLILDGFHKEA
jgi:hypothetical protein